MTTTVQDVEFSRKRYLDSIDQHHNAQQAYSIAVRQYLLDSIPEIKYTLGIMPHVLECVFDASNNVNDIVARVYAALEQCAIVPKRYSATWTETYNMVSLQLFIYGDDYAERANP
jgi:hypothetical protein